MTIRKRRFRGFPFATQDGRDIDEELKTANRRWRNLRSKQGLETLAQMAKLNSHTQAALFALMSIGCAGEALAGLYVSGTADTRELVRKKVKEILDLDLPSWEDAQSNNPIFPE